MFYFNNLFKSKLIEITKTGFVSWFKHNVTPKESMSVY